MYAFQREDLDAWQTRLDRTLPNGFFGENFTTRDLEVNEAVVGERWRIGTDVVLQVTMPRIPCATFRGWVGEPGWAKWFTAAGRPGAYLRVITPGAVTAGDPVEVIHRPDHLVTISLLFRATTTERDLLPSLLAAGDDLDPGIREDVYARRLVELDSPRRYGRERIGTGPPSTRGGSIAHPNRADPFASPPSAWTTHMPSGRSRACSARAASSSGWPPTIRARASPQAARRWPDAAWCRRSGSRCCTIRRST